MSLAVQQMFARIAGRYDLANDVLSFGIHRLWRRCAIRFAGISSERRILDFCTGTGDFAFSLAQATSSQTEIVAIDFVPEMISCAREKQAAIVDSQLRDRISFSTGDAMHLEFEDGSFDAATVGFGIRNVDDPVGCMSEVSRVLRGGGKLVVLEFGQPRVPIFSWCYRMYSKFLMPFLGGALTGDSSAYEYLPKTASEFPDRERFCVLMKDAGFEELRWRALFFGIAYIYVGKSPSQNNSLKTSQNVKDV